MLSLRASLLDRQGHSRRARRDLFLAASYMKTAGDSLDRLRLVIKRAITWYAAGIDPSRSLALCIDGLRQFPFAVDPLHAAHVTRLMARLYLADQLTGRYLAELRALRANLPPATSPFWMTKNREIEGLLAALGGEPAAGGRILRKAARWFEEHELFGDAAVCWIQYSWAVLEVDSESAREAALKAHEHLRHSGFNSREQKRIAREVHSAAMQRCLKREILRRAALLCVFPRVRPRPAQKPAGPGVG